MKLIIQIPCFNEEKTLPIALQDIPRQIDGVDQVEILVVDDGSTDGTYEAAIEHGVDHIVRHTTNKGLAKTFMTGITHSLSLGADIIVNTDADNQYFAGDIPKLIRPILERQADIVVGARPIDSISHFSSLKKILQKLGSSFVRKLSGVSVDDAPSGFRAFSRQAARQLNVFSSYTYTMETLVLASQKNLALVSVPVRVNADLRPSRLVKGYVSYITKSVLTIFRTLVLYRPLYFFTMLSSLLALISIGIGVRFLYFYLSAQGGGHIQSLILAAILAIFSFQSLLTGILSDLISSNRKLLEELKFMMNK
jgi:glycosyltransferase involved in cell wall biosynthesis